MNNIKDILKDLNNGKISVEDAEKLIQDITNDKTIKIVKKAKAIADESYSTGLDLSEKALELVSKYAILLSKKIKDTKYQRNNSKNTNTEEYTVIHMLPYDSDQPTTEDE